jgi:hypothetical protein
MCTSVKGVMQSLYNKNKKFMSEESKYYIPDLAEFHVGFEYEFRISAGVSYETFTTTYLAALYKIEDAINNNLIRVKYLDVDDIVSLGFSRVVGFDSMTKDSGYFKKGRYTLYYDQTDKHITISYNDYGNNITLFQSPHKNENCKNKSKLKQILIDIGVLQ